VFFIQWTQLQIEFKTHLPIPEFSGSLYSKKCGPKGNGAGLA